MPDDPTGDHADYPITIGCQEVKQLQDERASFLLLDCRNPDEFQAVHLEGATLVPMQELPQRIHEVEPFRDQRIVVYCHLGGRSMQVTEWLRHHGFHKAQNMVGGIDAWACTIDTSLPRYQ